MMKMKDLRELAWHQSKDAMRIIDKDGILLDANEAYCEIAGKRRVELVGKPFMSLFADYLRADILHEELQKFSPTSADRVTTRFVELWDGRMLWIEDRSTVIRSEIEKDVLLSLVVNVTQRIRNEISEANALEALRASAERYQALIESSQDWCWETDEEGAFTFVSKQVKSALGYEPAELQGRNAFAFMTNGIETGASNSFAELWSARKSFRDVQWVHRHKNGRLIFLESNGVPFGNERKDHIGYRGVSRDITERVLAEEALRSSEKKYRDLVAHSPDGIFIADATGRFLEVNRAMCEILEYSEKELLSMTIYDILPAEYREAHKVRLSRILQGQDSNVPAEYVAKGKNGCEYWTEVRSRQHLLGGGAVGFQGVARDISQRKQAELSLLMSEAKLSNALEMARLGHWEYDVASDLFTFNDQFYALFHTTVEQVGGYTMSPDSYAQRFVHPDDMAWVRRGIKLALESSDPHHSSQLEHRIIYADGGTGTITVRAFVLKDDQGRTIKTYGVNQDITERKRAEVALVKERELLKTIIETIPDEVCLKDLEHRFVLANSVSVQALGANSMDDLVGKTDLDFVPETLAREHLKEEEEIISSGIALTNSERVQRDPETGQISKCLLTTKVPVKNAGGKTAGIVVVNRYITDRKRAEEALVQSEKRYRTMFETTGTAAVLYDKDCIIHLVNKEFENLSGYSKQEVEGIVKWPEFVCDKDRDHMLELHRRRMQGAEDVPTHYEFAFVTRSGELRSIFLTINLIPGTSQCVCSLMDVTEQKKAADLLVQRSRELEAIVRSLDDIAFEIDEHGTCLNVWTADESLLAMPKSDLIGTTISETLGDVGQRILDSIRRVLETGERDTIEYPFEIQGEPRWFSAVVNRVEARPGFSQTASVLVRDMTERKNAEIQLRQSEEQYRSLVENERDVIFSLSPDGIIMSTNPAFAKITEWDTEEWVGRTFSDLFRPEDREMARQAVEAALDNGSGGSRECRLISRSGKDLLVEVTWAPQFMDGKICRILGIARDITEHRILESQLRQAQKLETLGTLAAGIAHDFNNILTIISGQVSLLEGGRVNLDLLAKRTNAIQNAVQRGTHLARQILTFTRKKTAGEGLVNVNEVIRDLSALLSETFPRSIEITFNLAKSEPILLTDQSQLHHALLNLCVNARDAIQEASPSGMAQGTLDLHTDIVPRERLGVTISTGGAQYFLCIKVSDTGVGMSEEIKKHIFEPFFTTKGEGRGTGLGLAAVFEFVSAYHGFIDVRSAVGEGTTFTLYFPSDDGRPSFLKSAKSRLDEPRGGSETILLIEDEKSLLDLMKIVLSDKGYTVLAEADGPGAINAFRRESANIDLVVTDLGMPQTDPMSMISTIRQIKPDVHIIVASGYALSTVKSELMEKGVKAFIPKPYNLNEILRIIRMVLDGKGDGVGFN
ncbi:MAG TPA: PAS domain S-box protein [Bacteroidota bacterium]|nr:PAS domain S-box protein [Bacteroidota bacterium]